MPSLLLNAYNSCLLSLAKTEIFNKSSMTTYQNTVSEILHGQRSKQHLPRCSMKVGKPWTLPRSITGMATFPMREKFLRVGQSPQSLSCQSADGCLLVNNLCSCQSFKTEFKMPGIVYRRVRGDRKCTPLPFHLQEYGILCNYFNEAEHYYHKS